MAILDLNKLEELSPRSKKKILCQCDRCGAIRGVAKANLYRSRHEGKYVSHRVGQEPEGFKPRYGYCNSCERVVNPSMKGKTLSDETKARISAKVTAIQTGRKRPPEWRASLSRSKTGEKNPQWKADREYIAGLRKLRKTVGNAIHNMLRHDGARARRRSLEILGYTKEDLVSHIESQFVDGMEWGNIHIDHILPVSAFYDHGITDLRIISHLSNLQPLFPCDNSKKFNTYDKDQFDAYMQRFSQEDAAQDAIAS